MNVCRKRFMSYKKKVIYYGKLDDGTIYYMVSNGDGTDKYFTDLEDAMNYVSNLRKDQK